MPRRRLISALSWTTNNQDLGGVAEVVNERIDVASAIVRDNALGLLEELPVSVLRLLDEFLRRLS